MKINKRVVLIVLDGWGISKNKIGNAILMARKPFFDSLWKNYPHATIKAAGPAVGLWSGSIGNSEAGHSNLGAGRIILQPHPRISKNIDDKSFYKNKALLGAINHVKKNRSALHIVGLVGKSDVHSSLEHLEAVINLIKRSGLKNVYLHAITDGRDTRPKSGKDVCVAVDNKMKRLDVGRIATVVGRYFAMDRDNRWLRTALAFQALTEPIKTRSESVKAAMLASYKKGVTDEFIKPIIIGEAEKSRIKNNDAVIFFNFRADRARQLTRAFVDKSFNKFKRGIIFKNLYFTTFIEYATDLKTNVAFPVVQSKNCLPEVLSKQGLKQFNIAETEKYAHVTYFFSNGRRKPFAGTKWELILSPQVAYYTSKPEMRAGKITDETVKAIKSKQYNFILINFANADMLGHTGNFGITKHSIEFLDKQLKIIVSEASSNGYELIITGDHGNAEEMIDKKDLGIITSHTTNSVPFILVSSRVKSLIRKDGKLADIAPTILDLLGLAIPKDITGKSLVKIKKNVV